VAKYYTRITLERLTQLLDLPVARTEEILSRLVVSKTVYARIDRPAGTINFREPRGTDNILNEWSNDVEKLMVRPSLQPCPFSRSFWFLSIQSLVEKTTHLVSKEYAVHGAKMMARTNKA
jgi:26S proteasome regulatory subunit N5